MVDFDEQLRSYSTWLAEQVDRRVEDQGRARSVRVAPTQPEQHNGRRWWPLVAVAAVVSALVLGLVATVGTRDAQAPADQPSSLTTPTSPAPTTAPTTTVAATTTTPSTTPATTAPAVTPTTTPSTVAETTVDQALVPRDVDDDMVRPLADLAEGDVLIPTYIPSGMVFYGPVRVLGPTTSLPREVLFTLQTTDQQVSVGVRLWESDGPVGPLEPEFFEDPDHPPLEIADLTWGWYDDEETYRVAHVDRFGINVLNGGLDDLEFERFIEGLRAGGIEQFPSPIPQPCCDRGE